MDLNRLKKELLHIERPFISKRGSLNYSPNFLSTAGFIDNLAFMRNSTNSPLTPKKNDENEE